MIKITIREIQRIIDKVLELGYDVTVESELGYKKEEKIIVDRLYGDEAYNQSIFGDCFDDCDWRAVTDSDTPMQHTFIYDSFESYDNAGYENKQLNKFVWSCEDELN